MQAVSVKASDVTKRFTVRIRVTGLRRLKVRFAIGSALIKLGAMIIGMNCVIEDSFEAQG